MIHRDDVVDVIHGCEVADPYRWLEDDHAPAVQEWTADQNARTTQYLNAIPGRAEVATRLRELLGIGDSAVPARGGDRYFYLERGKGEEADKAWMREGTRGRARIVIDPQKWSADATRLLKWAIPSPDGTHLAFCLANGSEAVVHVLHIDTETSVSEPLADVASAGVAWDPRRLGFYYARLRSVDGTGAPQQCAVLFREFPRRPDDDPVVFECEAHGGIPVLELAPHGRWLLIIIPRGRYQDVYLQDLESHVRHRVAVGLDARFDGTVCEDGLYLRTNLHGPTFGLYELSLDDPAFDRAREIVAPHPTALLEAAVVADRHVVLAFLERAVSTLRVMSRDGAAMRVVPLPKLAGIVELATTGHGRECFVSCASFRHVPSVYQLDPATASVTLWHSATHDEDLQGLELEEVFYPSRDGTLVSMLLLRPKTIQLDRSHPVLLTAFNALGARQASHFSRSMMVWLEHGGVVGIVYPRGSGEYGSAWHEEGRLAKAQNRFDDFAAAAEWLLEKGYTRAGKIAAMAKWADGGLLVSAVLTQRPELFGAVVIPVPLTDMVRFDRSASSDALVREYGSPSDPVQFRHLFAYSPYHRVRDGTAYPAVAIISADGGGRTEPLHARKFTARLQVASTSKRPVLLRAPLEAARDNSMIRLHEDLLDVFSFTLYHVGALGDVHGGR